MQKTKQKNWKKIKYSNNKYFVVSRNKKKIKSATYWAPMA